MEHNCEKWKPVSWPSEWVTGQEVSSAGSSARSATGNVIWDKSLQLQDLFVWITLCGQNIFTAAVSSYVGARLIQGLIFLSLKLLL